jgi:hypothetical protein
MNHNYTKEMMISLAVAFMILPVVFIGLRIWAKVISKRLAWDDYLAIAALVSRYWISSLNESVEVLTHNRQSP